MGVIKSLGLRVYGLRFLGSAFPPPSGGLGDRLCPVSLRMAKTPRGWPGLGYGFEDSF